MAAAKRKRIILTGGAGFIGSALLAFLNAEGMDNILVVDHLDHSDKWKNLVNKRFADYLDRESLLKCLASGSLQGEISTIFHLGACTSTTVRDAQYMMAQNYEYSKCLADFALKNDIRFIYASSAATYGSGDNGFEDNENELYELAPLNIYGFSKHRFDSWLHQRGVLDRVTGFKFFNVYGPNEYEKGEMASVVLKAFWQAQTSGEIALFRSYRPDFADGEQKRDFVYVKDVASVLCTALESSARGVFNLGTGTARSWLDLAKAVFSALDQQTNVRFIEMPEELRARYQYFTQAEMRKFQLSDLRHTFYSLEDGVRDYISNYLVHDQARI